MNNGWTPERRARQSMLIRTWNPSSKSTGPKTKAGKAHSSQNAYKHGERSHENLLFLKFLREVFHVNKENINQINFK